jgi:hypothetical protein
VNAWHIAGFIALAGYAAALLLIAWYIGRPK